MTDAESKLKKIQVESNMKKNATNRRAVINQTSKRLCAKRAPKDLSNGAAVSVEIPPSWWTVEALRIQVPRVKETEEKLA